LACSLAKTPKRTSRFGSTKNAFLKQSPEGEQGHREPRTLFARRGRPPRPRKQAVITLLFSFVRSEGGGTAEGVGGEKRRNSRTSKKSVVLPQPHRGGAFRFLRGAEGGEESAQQKLFYRPIRELGRTESHLQRGGGNMHPSLSRKSRTSERLVGRRDKITKAETHRHRSRNHLIGGGRGRRQVKQK